MRVESGYIKTDTHNAQPWLLAHTHRTSRASDANKNWGPPTVSPSFSACIRSVGIDSLSCHGQTGHGEMTVLMCVCVCYGTCLACHASTAFAC